MSRTQMIVKIFYWNNACHISFPSS